MLKIKSITPKLSKEILFQETHCYLGISLGNKYIEQPYLESIIEWIDNNFKQCMVIIGDYLNRYNEFSSYEDNVAEAIEKNLLLGEKIEKKINHLLPQYKKCHFKIIRWKDFLDKNIEYSETRRNYYCLYENNKDFRDSINDTANIFIKTQEKRNSLKTSASEAFKISIDYLIEEISVFDILAKKNYKVKIYPGTILSVLKKVANAEIKGVNTNIKNGIYVEISLKSKQ